MKCPSCRTRQLVVIQIRVAGDRIELLSCSHCDQRWWQGIDGTLSLATVLDLAAEV
jgi:transcriptional regulator NrdR family protein